MIAEFKSNEGYANSYVICRFHECIIINPSHSYESIISYVGARNIIGLFVTEVSKHTIDQIGYYQVPLYLTKQHYEAIKSENIIDGYRYSKEYPFYLEKINVQKIEEEKIFLIGDLELKIHMINGLIKPVTVFELEDNLFVGNLFDDKKIAKKATYKGAIYDLKRSITKFVGFSDYYTLYHSYRAKIR